MRIVLSSMRRPREVTGRVCNQEPDSFLEADKSLILDKGSGAVAKSSAAMEEMWTIQRWQNQKGRVVTPGNEMVLW